MAKDGLLKDFALNSSALVGYQMTSYLSSVISTVFIGRLGDSLSLAAYGMARTVLGMGFNAFILGVQESLGVVCSRFYGAQQYTDLWRYLWKSLFIAFCLAAFCHVLCIYSTGLMLAINIEPEVAVSCNRLLRYCAISLYFQGTSQVINNFLSAQHVTKPLFYLNFMSIIIVYASSSLFINYLGMAELGFAFAKLCQDLFSTGYYIAVIVLYVDKSHFEAPSVQSIRTHFWNYLVLNVYTTLAFYGEILAFQIGTYYAALLHNVDALATWVTYIGFTAFHFFTSMGFGSATRNIVGRRVGEHNIIAARSESIRCMRYITVVSIVIIVLEQYYRDSIARIFTSKESIVEQLKPNIDLFSVGVISTLLGPSVNSLYRIVGKESFMFWVNVVYYPVAIAISSYIFCFTMGLGVWGLNLAHVLTKVMVCTALGWHLYYNIEWENPAKPEVEAVSVQESLIERSIDIKGPKHETELI